MGGLAIKNAFTRRYSKEEFENIIPDILEKARRIFPEAVSTQAYRDKDSFGDADILCLSDGSVNIDIKQWIYDTFQSKEVVQNTTVYSFEYKELQVDFILTPPKNWESAQTYFSYNDIHNLIGKLFHTLGLKWGQDGLRYVYRRDGKVLGEIAITTDYREAFPLVGLAPSVYTRGFDNLVQMFDYVMTSPYFSPKKYDLENLNKINRDRDKKRKTYQAFMAYIEPLREKEYRYFYPDKRVYLGLIDDHFPGFLKKYRDLEIIDERRTYINGFYNGRIVMDSTGLSGKDLGAAMTKFEEHFGGRPGLDYYVELTEDSGLIMEKFKAVNGL